jgi:prophage maintenance system killer protein
MRWSWPTRADQSRRFSPARPLAGFGDQDFYPDLIDKAAVLTCRLGWNHPLPDGNKRGADRAAPCHGHGHALLVE